MDVEPLELPSPQTSEALNVEDELFPTDALIEILVDGRWYLGRYCFYDGSTKLHHVRTQWPAGRAQSQAHYVMAYFIRPYREPEELVADSPKCGHEHLPTVSYEMLDLVLRVDKMIEAQGVRNTSDHDLAKEIAALAGKLRYAMTPSRDASDRRRPAPRGKQGDWQMSDKVEAWVDGAWRFAYYQLTENGTTHWVQTPMAIGTPPTKDHWVHSKQIRGLVDWDSCPMLGQACKGILAEYGLEMFTTLYDLQEEIMPHGLNALIREQLRLKLSDVVGKILLDIFGT